jgi:hypothetical protein
MFINNYRDYNYGITLTGIKGLGKIESLRKESLVSGNFKNIQISLLWKLKEAIKIYFFSG